MLSRDYEGHIFFENYLHRIHFAISNKLQNANRALFGSGRWQILLEFYLSRADLKVQFHMAQHSIRTPIRSARYVLLCVHRRGIPLKDITLNTSICYDTGLDGDDAEELLLDIDRLERIDWTGFNFQDYFTDEGLLIFRSMYVLLLWFLTPARFLFKFLFQQAGWSQNSTEEKDIIVAYLTGAHYHLSWLNRHLDPGLYKKRSGKMEREV